MSSLFRLQSLCKGASNFQYKVTRDYNNYTAKICIVGSGASGIHTAIRLLRKVQALPIEVDVIERLPVPFGSFRFSFYRDYLTNKLKRLDEMSEYVKAKRARLLGNVTFGRDVTLQELREAYHVVVLAYGAAEQNKLEIDGSDLKNIFHARDFLGWCSGVPSNKDLPVDLSGTTATIFGHGGMASEIGTILLSPVDKLKSTDVPEHALSILSRSNIKEVNLIGRRGPRQVSFCWHTVYDLLYMKGCCNVWNAEDMDGIEPTDLEESAVDSIIDSFQSRRTPNPNEKLLRMRFLRAPKEFQGGVKVERVKLGVNKLDTKENAILTRDEEMINTDLIVNSIGYKSVKLDPDIPFDPETGTVKHTKYQIEPGLYATGWLADGVCRNDTLPSMVDNGFDVADKIDRDLMRMEAQDKPGFEYLGKVLSDKNIQVVSWWDYLKINQYEINEGKKVGKPREKIVDIDKMLAIAAS